MKNKTNPFLTLWKKLLHPPIAVQVLAYGIALLSAIGAISILFVDYENSPLAILAYTLFGIAGISLSYAVYLFIRYTPKLKQTAVKWMEKNNFTYLLLRNYGFRTIIFSILSFIISLAFAIFNGFLGLGYRSIWYGALASYYIFLVFLRGGILLHHKNRLQKKNLQKNEELRQAQVYRNCGIIILVLNIALSSAIAQMIFDDRTFTYEGWLIFAYAAYAFYKVTMSVVHLFKARTHTDMTIQAIRNVNLTDACVSILALQTALLHTFQSGNVDISLFNTLTGSIVSILTILIGIYMIIHGNRAVKEIQTENIYE